MMWEHIKNILTLFSRCLPNQHQLSLSGKLSLLKFQTILQSQLAVTAPGLQALESQLPYAGESLPSPPASRGTFCTLGVSPLAQTSPASVKSVRSVTGEDINNSLSMSEEPKVR